MAAPHHRHPGRFSNGWRALRIWPCGARDLLMLVVRGYRFFLSPWLGSACRFEPTCSAYALAALQAHGALTGSRLTLLRLARCHPGCAGGHDPVPTHPAPLFTSLLRGRQTPAVAVVDDAVSRESSR